MGAFQLSHPMSRCMMPSFHLFRNPLKLALPERHALRRLARGIRRIRVLGEVAEIFVDDEGIYVHSGLTCHIGEGLS